MNTRANYIVTFSKSFNPPEELRRFIFNIYNISYIYAYDKGDSSTTISIDNGDIVNGQKIVKFTIPNKFIKNIEEIM